MIFADKLIALRKKSGWSQEELAEKLGVSRQSVSKWESMTAMPDLDKVIKIAALFEVSTDILLKDELTLDDTLNNGYGDRNTESVKTLSLEYVNEYIDATARSAKRIALGVFMCIISPITLILLGGMSDSVKAIGEGAAFGIGITVLLMLVAVATGLFIIDGMSQEKYSYLKKTDFELQYGVKGIMTEKRKAQEKGYTTCTVCGVGLCIIAPLPLILCGAFEAAELVLICLVGLLLLLVAVAVYMFIVSGTNREALNIILKEDEYKPERRAHKKLESKISGIYWPIIVIAYLATSFLTDCWHLTWIIWPVAGVLYGVICAIFGITDEN